MQRSKLGLLVAAAAAFGAYKYSKMTPEQKTNLMNKGKSLFDNNLGGLRNLFGKKTETANGNGY